MRRDLGVCMIASRFKRGALIVVAVLTCLMPSLARANPPGPPIQDNSQAGSNYHSFYDAFKAANFDTDYNDYYSGDRKIDPKEVLFCVSAKNNITYRCKYGGTVKVKGTCYYVPPKGATGNKAKKTGWQMTGVGQCSSILIQQDLGPRCEITVRACPFILQGKKAGSKALLGTTYMTKATFDNVPMSFANPPPFCTPTNGAAPVSISGPPYVTTPFELLDSCTESSPASEVKAITDILAAPGAAPAALWQIASGKDISTAGIIAGLQKTNFQHNHGAIFTDPSCDGLATTDLKKTCCETDRYNYWNGFCSRLDYKMAPKVPKVQKCKLTKKEGIFPGPGGAPSSLGGQCNIEACGAGGTTCAAGWTHDGHHTCTKDFPAGDIFTQVFGSAATVVLDPCTGLPGQFFKLAKDDCDFDFLPQDEDECTGTLSNLSAKAATAQGITAPLAEANGLQVVEYDPDGAKDIYHPEDFKLKKGPHQQKAGKAKVAAVEANFYGQQLDTVLPEAARLKHYNNGSVSCNDYCQNNGQYWGFKGNCVDPPDPSVGPGVWAPCGPVLGNIVDPTLDATHGLACYCSPTQPIDSTGFNSDRNPMPAGTITNSAQNPEAGASPLPQGKTPTKGNGPNYIGQ